MSLSLPKLNNKTLIIILVLLGIAVYANTLRNGMFWDDNDFILQNQYVREFAAGKFFSENLIAGAGFVSNYWRPALLAVFALEWRIFHNFAAGYHFVNMAVHIADGVLLFYILQRLFHRRSLAFATAIIFIVHPLQTEAVSYANSLGDSLSVFFMFAGILLFQKGRRIWPLAMYALALMTKETAIIMPALLAIVNFFSSPREERIKVRLLSVLRSLWPYLALAAIYILLRATILNFQNTFNLYNEANIFTQSISVRILTFFRILTVYFGLMFWPRDLHMERSVEIATNFSSLSVIGGALIFALLISITLLAIKKQPPVAFGILWFLIGIAPTSNIAVPINGLLYEHWLYLPLIGIFLAVIWFGLRVGERFPKLNPMLAVIFALATFGMSGRAIARNLDWHDPIRFYNKTLKTAPTSYRLWNNLGMAYADAGENEKAEDAYSTAIALQPHIAVALYNLGNLYRDTGRGDQAIEYYHRALAADSGFIYSQNALLKLYLDQKKYADARKAVEQYYPAGVQKLEYLAQLAVAENDYAAALQYIKQALELDPGNPAIQQAYLETKSKIK